MKTNKSGIMSATSQQALHMFVIFKLFKNPVHKYNLFHIVDDKIEDK